MKKRLFPATMEFTTTDLDKIGDVAEEGIADFVRAIASQNDPSGVIFTDNSALTDDSDWTASGSAPWTINIPTQHFYIGDPDGFGGALGKLTATSFVMAGTSARSVAVFLRLTRTVATANRNYIDLTGAGPVVGNASFDVEQDWSADIVVVDNYVDASDDPVAGDDDVGAPIKLVKFNVTTGPSAFTVTLNPDSRDWIINAGTPADHAASHITGGGDAIQLATPSQDGLMSQAYADIVEEAVTAVSVDAGSSFLLATTTAGPPKTVAIALRLVADSLKKINVSGTDRLGLNFGSGAFAGVSNRPARADHKHPMTDSPVQVVSATVAVTSAAQLGTSVSVTVPSSVTTVMGVECFWIAPTLSSQFPRVACGWSTVPVGGVSRKVGCHALLAGPRDLQLRLGDALCEMSTAELGVVEGVLGSQTWDSVGGSAGMLPTTGTILVVITGVRT